MMDARKLLQVMPIMRRQLPLQKHDNANSVLNWDDRISGPLSSEPRHWVHAQGLRHGEPNKLHVFDVLVRETPNRKTPVE